MKIVVFISFLFLSFSLSAEVTIPADALAKRAGKYEVLVTFAENRHAKRGVRGLLYIPQMVNAAERPLLIFYHGSTRKKTFYRKIKRLKKWADKYKFSLLSMQNWWMLSGNDTSGINESRWATNRLCHKLVAAKTVKADAIYTMGFSAGGFTAMAVVLNSLEDKYHREAIGNKPEVLQASFFEYAGFASIKGNFYHNVIHPKLDERGDTKLLYDEIYKDKISYITVGGKKDASRVRKQAPEAFEFLNNYLGIKTEFKKFPKEGHSFSASNFKPFWALIEQKLRQ